MKIWPVQDAKARLSEFLEACATTGPQMAKRGVEAIVLVPAAEGRRRQALAKPLLKELLLSHVARTECLISTRNAVRVRLIPSTR
ncbi:type II toxin-antitoxin system Phd/YefM family antitoxin [Variovorax sp. IB41]|uniref:type II toxin-antitoxin system Phd/YefM family antitoxin n=1 Tax=Variovorax sp. IB41 TaxID=2779370 RepID=UPI0018E7FB42|nr:type II toxin-antitoxin system Phd/YefM family antitoxin [Variovorax sp. IB41]MBJ2160259.1 type II toxin-antitoxin system Phd/YefM family antitoxin [Variovorax sp. IB41]